MAKAAGGKSSLIVAFLLAGVWLLLAPGRAEAAKSDEAKVATFKVAVAGFQGQSYTVEPDEGFHCQRYGTGAQLVRFLSDKVRVEVAETPRGYRFLRRGRTVKSLLLPIQDAGVGRLDYTQRTDGACDYNYETNPPSPVPLPPKDCTGEDEFRGITDTMDSFDLFLTGPRPEVSGGYFWLYEQGGDVIYGDPFENCLAFGYDGRAGDGFLEGARLPRLPDNLLDRRGARRFKAKAKRTFTREEEPTGVGFYTYEGETYDDYRVGSDVVAEETVNLTLYMKRVRP